ncbi:hypothetical protein RUM44_011028 [Polyplax serrata]|uniref:Uncharacterized protein n=1 Tax=Polyplax serrata TaxID=468196 RepID=A0ABR1ANW5_POLSC
MSGDEPKKTSFWKQRLTRHVPVLSWIRNYKKSDFVADMIAGITLGLTLIPQSVAYAALAGVSAEYGLYSSFMGGFIYFLFGTVREVSVGPTSLIALLTFEFTRDLPIEFVFLLALFCGIIEFTAGLLQLGFLVNFIPTPVITSFQSATAIIIVTSQMKSFFGVPKFKYGKFLNNIYNVMKRIGQANLGDVVLSICCCIFLLSLRKLNDLKIMKSKKLSKKQNILKKALWFTSISRNALCVFLSCFVAYAFTKDGGVAPFKLSGSIPSGLPSFRPPPTSIQLGNQTMSFFEMVYEISPGLLVIPLISILANVTIAKAYAAGSPVDATQEMITLGLVNMGGSLFGAFPCCGAFTRSAVASSSGVRTPLAGLFTSTLILLVIKFLTPYFYYIPTATLASVLICAVVFMIDVKTMWLLWKGNKRDFICAMVTFFSGLLIGIQVGLALGIIFSLAHLLYMWARPSIAIAIKATPKGSYYLVTPDIGLFFPSNDFLRREIITRCDQNIPIVIDFLRMKGIDYTSSQGIKELSTYYKSRDRRLAFINMSRDIYTVLKNSRVELQLKECIQYSAEEELRDVLFHTDNPDGAIAILAEDITKAAVELQDIPEQKTLI